MMTEPKAPSWLALTNEIDPTWQGIIEQLGADHVDTICTGQWYEMSHAAIALALNLAIDQTDLTPRKKRRIGPVMLGVMFKVIPMVFMFGWMARDAQSETVETGKCEHCGCVILPGKETCGACGAPIERDSDAQ